MLTIIGQDIISGSMGYIGTEPGRLYRMGPQSKVTEASGEPPVVLADCKKKPLKGLTIYGKSKQVTTTGAQLLDPNKATVDGWNIKYDIPLEKSKTYTFTNGEKAANSVAIFGVNPDEADENLSVKYLSPKESYTFTCAKDYASIILGGSDEKTVFDGRYMLNAGSTPLPWEPYTGGKSSPSPDYPQEIESAGMRWSTGKNLLDTDNINTSTNSTWAIHQNGYSITAQGTYAENDSNAYKNVHIALDPAIVAGKKITASVEYAENDANESLRAICDINYTRQSKTYYNLFGVNNPITITIPEDVVLVRCRIHIIELKEESAEYGTYTTTVKGVMISTNDNVVPWEPYTDGIPKPYGDKIGVEVRGKNMIPLPYPLLGGAGTQVEYKGVKYTVQADGGIRCIGTPSSVFGVSLSSIRFSDKPLYASAPTDGKVVLSGGPLYFDKNNNKLFFFFGAEQVGNPIDTVIYPQIELGTVATAYEPYHAPQSMSISTPNGLPGIPVSSGDNYTDADGQQWICDEIDFTREVYVQNIKVSKSLNKLEWFTWGVNKGANGITGFYTYDIDIPKIDKAISNIERYNVDIYGGKRTGIKASIITPESSTPYMIVCVRNDTISDTSSDNAAIRSFKEMLAKTDAYMMYVLATPVETPLTDEQIAAYKQLRTYKGTTIIDNDAGAYMSVKYNT